MLRNDVRNLCIMAHVDHGKTTLVDFLLRQAGQFADHEKMVDRVMDSNDLERERGITIMAKNTSILVKGSRLNIVDTPGHADFGGEVERILGSVDGAILLVDAAEGPLPQTRFVLQKSLEKNHKVILCINKVDRPEVQGDGMRRINEVIDATFDLFVELGATDEQTDFPIIYACARQGWCTTNIEEIPDLIAGTKKGSLEPMFDSIIEKLPPPQVEEGAPFRMQLSNLAWSDYVGQLSVGRVVSGKVKKGQNIVCLGLSDDGSPRTISFPVSKLFAYDGLRQIEVEELQGGDIGIVAGCDQVMIGDTLAENDTVAPFVRLSVDPPTLKMQFSINNGPMAGKEGEAIQSRKLRDRLIRECRANVALRFEETDGGDAYYLLGRGELQFAILIETMRREGYEFLVGRPQVMFRKDPKTQETLEPIEIATLDLPETYSGDVTALFQGRKGILTSYENLSTGRTRLKFELPARGLIGIRSRYLTITRGDGLFSSELKGYEPYKGHMLHRKNGTLISDRSGQTTDYALSALEERGVLFIKPGIDVYEGMIIGECSRENDLNVNPVKPKKLTNVRSVSSDGLILLAGTKNMSLEEYIEWLEDDEWIEVTPQSIRVRKKVLPGNLRSVVRGIKDKK
jgi:GTP-binding protein